jgi:hypothetical protein
MRFAPLSPEIGRVEADLTPTMKLHRFDAATYFLGVAESWSCAPRAAPKPMG